MCEREERRELDCFGTTHGECTYSINAFNDKGIETSAKAYKGGRPTRRLALLWDHTRQDNLTVRGLAVETVISCGRPPLLLRLWYISFCCGLKSFLHYLAAKFCSTVFYKKNIGKVKTKGNAICRTAHYVLRTTSCWPLILTTNIEHCRLIWWPMDIRRP